MESYQPTWSRFTLGRFQDEDVDEDIIPGRLKLMAMPFEKIVDINETIELWKIAVKVHQKWTVISNIKEHIELIFVDDDGTDVHVIVPITLKATFDSVLLVNNTYTVTNFLPQINDLRFKTSEHPFVIKITPETHVSDINKHEIPGKRLNFKSFAEIISGNWRNNLLVDRPTSNISQFLFFLHQPTTIEVKLFDDQVNQIRESVDEAILVGEWNTINDLEITSKLNSQFLPSDPSAIMNNTTPEKAKATTSPPVTPINQKVNTTTPPPVTPMGKGSISQIKNEPTWRRRRLDEVYIQYEELRNSRNINERNLVLPIAGSSSNLVDAPIYDSGNKPKGKGVVEVEEIVVGEHVTLKGLMQGCNKGEAMNLKRKQVDLGEKGGKGKIVDGKIGRTTADAAPSQY
ncbi:hypothetical protein KIW84_013631 [Lathyrus oleraceus]|uniref:Replication protein A 70 kDa DNA-binding subunit B/D first OB fold domain-containing protein n=1 Tax=Pisum sativum TaxID=3888 RepID=A0A9D5BKJ3_PEA|nr:hypothetical protein KIW84_013631 [Pisum sativum]